MLVMQKRMVCECGQVHLFGSERSKQTCDGIGAVLAWAYGRHQLKYEYGWFIANLPLGWQSATCLQTI